MRRNLWYLAVTMCLIACPCYAQGSDPDVSARPSDLAVSPAAGESWLNHIHRSFGDTSMGKTGRLGPNPVASDPAYKPDLLGPSQGSTVTLRGSDLYRLNCRGCHGENGAGAPPEINSLIDPVRATSASLLMERMKKTGMAITPAAASELARQAQDALLQRLHKGGRDMPAFPHLNEAELHALVGYLNQLAGIPGAKQLTVTESPLRIGEQIVKSTCHTCHDAAGANPTPQELEDGAIPPLETLTARTDELQLIRKVTIGAPISMGTPPSPHRGRMPVFYYLTPEEAADVYLYLSTYPPSRLETASIAGAAAPQNPPQDAPPPIAPQSPKSDPKSSRGLSDGAVTLLLIALGSLALVLAIGGFGFVAYELSRLGKDGESRAHHVTHFEGPEQYRGDGIVQQRDTERFALR